MQRLLIFIICFFPFQLFAQAALSTGFYLLRKDTIFELDQRLDGHLQFKPFYHHPFLDSIGAIAYNADDRYWYGVSYLQGTFMRFRLNEPPEQLGLAREEQADSLLLPNDLTSMVYHEGALYLLSFSEQSIYRVRLDNRPLRYQKLCRMKQQLPNTLSYDPNRKKLLLMHQQGGSIYIDPKTGEQEIHGRQYRNFKRKSLLSYGKTWFDGQGRCFLLAGAKGELFELDHLQHTAYRIEATGFNSAKDATTAILADQASPFAKDLSSFKIDPYVDGPAMQINWRQGPRKDLLRYELQVNRSDGRGWITLQTSRAQNAKGQAGYYAVLDRYLKEGWHCYRLNIQYQGGDSRLSREICSYYDGQMTVGPSALRVSPQLLSPEENRVYVNIRGLAEQNAKIRIYRAWDRRLLKTYDIKIRSEENSFQLELPLVRDWYLIEVLHASHPEYFIVYQSDF